MLEHFLWQFFQEFKNPRTLPLVLAECFVIHKQIHHFPATVVPGHPVSEFFGRQRPLRPVARRKTKRNVIGKFVVFQKQFYLCEPFGAINEIRTAPTQNIVFTLRDNPFKTERFGVTRYIIIIYQLRVSEYSRIVIEKFFDQSAMRFHLLFELVKGIKRRKRVMVSFRQKLRLPGFDQLVKRIQHFRHIFLRLLQEHAGKRIAHFEIRVLFQKP